MHEELPAAPSGERTIENDRRPLEPFIRIVALADEYAEVERHQWLNAAVPPEILAEKIERHLDGSADPDNRDWIITEAHDFGSYQLDHSEDIDRLAALALGITAHGLAFAAWATLPDHDLLTPETFTTDYCGEYEAPEAWAQELLDDTGLEHQLDTIDDLLRPYLHIDLDGLARDSAARGDITFTPTGNGHVWAFRS